MKQMYKFLFLTLMAVQLFACRKELGPLAPVGVPAENPANCGPLLQKTVVRLNPTLSDSAWLQLPCQYAKSGTTKYPLLVFLNGKLEGSAYGDLRHMLQFGPPKFMADSLRFSFNAAGQVHNMIVICPQSRGGFRNPLGVNQIIDYMVANYQVDERRIYLTGLSAGAQSVLQYLTDKPEYARRIAAAVPVSSTELDESHLANLKYISDAKLPVRFFCGKYDTRYFGLNWDYVNRINQNSPGLAIMTDYAGAHGSWNRMYDVSHRYYKPNLYEWMLQFHR